MKRRGWLVALLGLDVYFGLEERWLAPFNDDLRTRLARFSERSLAKAAKRMGQLPGRLSDEIT